MIDRTPVAAPRAPAAPGRRSRSALASGLAAAALAAAALLPVAADDAPLAGRWTLVEQRYAGGRADVARPGSQIALELEFEPGAPGARARVRFGTPAAVAFLWPAVLSEGSPAPMTVIERTVDLAQRRARAVYRIDPPDGRGWSLVITEEYAVDARGELSGRMDVRMLDGDAPRGGYVLHRRFQRRP